MRLPVFQSLKFQIVVIALAAATIAALGSALNTRHVMMRELERDESEEQRVTSELVARLIDNKLQTVLDALTAGSQPLRTMDLQDQAAVVHYLTHVPALGTLVSPIVAVDADRRVIARTDGRNAVQGAPRMSDDGPVARALQRGRGGFSEPTVSPRTGRPRVAVVVLLERDGRPGGALAGSMDLDTRILFTPGLLPADARASTDVIVDAHGTIVAHSDPRRIMTSLSGDVDAMRVFEQVRARPASSRAGISVLQPSVLIAAARIPVADWYYLRVVPRAHIEGPSVATTPAIWRQALVAGSISALLAGASAWLLLRPIARLTRRVRDLQAPDDAGALPPWPDGAGEIGELSRSFRQLLQRQRRDADDVRRALAQTEAVLANAETGIALVRDGIVEMISERLRPLLLWDTTPARGRAFAHAFETPAAWQAIEQQARGAFAEGRVLDTETQMRRADGTLFWAHVRVRALPSLDLTTQGHGSIWVIEDITDRRDQHRALNWAATHDSLTGLTNRAAFEAMLESASSHASQQPFCALFIDLDRFKQVNDDGGHAAGDQMLRDVAALLTSSVRQTDVAARLGGDEFAVLLANCSSARALAIAEHLRAAIESHRLQWQGRQFAIGASIGLYEGTQARNFNAAQVLEAADQACYDAKRSGRNRISSFLPLES